MKAVTAKIQTRFDNIFVATDFSPASAHAIPFGRDLAALSGIQILCFLALSRLEPQFFIIHLFELIPYIAIIILLACGQQRWAYSVAPLVSLGWLVLAYSSGILESAVCRLRAFDAAGPEGSLVALLALTTAGLALLMTVVSRIHWVGGFSGRGRTFSTVLGSLVVVAGYYAALLHWFWDMMRNS